MYNHKIRQNQKGYSPTVVSPYNLLKLLIPIFSGSAVPIEQFQHVAEIAFSFSLSGTETIKNEGGNKQHGKFERYSDRKESFDSICR